MKIIVHNYGKLRVDNQNKEDSMGFLEQFNKVKMTRRIHKTLKQARMVKMLRWLRLTKDGFT